ncbi:MAG: aspartate-semialdehyde dehydrogenase [Planctomycetota bacterium]|nr:aspartate-semialdehyde dehydrogenase [Planctomycetota bacterium]
MQTPRKERLPVALYGATGVVGQRFLQILADHPWFELVEVRASSESAGQALGKRTRGVCPEKLQDLVLGGIHEGSSCRLVFSALPSEVAYEREASLRAAGHLVVTNAASHRLAPDVPLVIPEVNPEHLDLILDPSKGAIIANPNCSTAGLVLAVAPLARAFGLNSIHAVTLQALSGMGSAAPTLEEFAGKISPFIPGEEEKIELETRRLLGTLEGGSIQPAELAVAATSNRVPVVDGHTACVSVSLGRPVEREEILEAWSAFSGVPQALGLPSAPAQPVVCLEGDDVPRPEHHVDEQGGMAISVGRLRRCPILDWRFTTLSHNAIRGAAGGAVLLAELACERGLLGE